MPLNIVEPSLENVKSDLDALYVKDAKSGKYHLELSDLTSYVDARVARVEDELKLARENERKLSLSVALRQAGVDPVYEELVLANIGGRVALDTADNQCVIRILQTDGETPMVGSGPKGLAILHDLVQEAVKKFPSAFKSDSGLGGMPAPGIATKSDFKSEKDRAAWVSKNGLEAYDKLGTEETVANINRKSDFKSEKQRAAFVGKNGLAAYKALAD